MTIPTDAQALGVVEWRTLREHGEEYQLPTGLQVMMRRVSVLDLVCEGKIPTTLDPLVDEVTNAGVFAVARFREFEPLVNLVVMACIVTPSLGETRDANHVGIRELSVDDRLAVFTWANAGAGQLQKFRPKSASDVGDLQPGDRVRPTAEQPDRAD
jgi:hypothetical protein